MPRKSLIGSVCLLALVTTPNSILPATASDALTHFIGDTTCLTSYCHGGASHENGNNAGTLHTSQDVHARAYLTLINARSKQIAAAARLGNPTQENACTICHAPMSHVPANLRKAPLNITDGLACESCHGPAESWLRSHAREDYSYRDRVHAGMRDLANPYVRANQCVACHQSVPSNLLVAGHPELIFELDGQTAEEPPHWKEDENWNGARAWLVGQAVALRELSWQLEKESSPSETVRHQWSALLWLLQSTGTVQASLPAAPVDFQPAAIKTWSDTLARQASEMAWTTETTDAIWRALLETETEFTSSTETLLLARRAERLVLALDRLFKNRPAPANAQSIDAFLDELFNHVQILPDFDPAAFRQSLQKLQKI